MAKKTATENARWINEKNVCSVFADILSRTKNEDFLSKALEKLTNADILQQEQVDGALKKYSENVAQKVRVTFAKIKNLSSVSIFKPLTYYRMRHPPSMKKKLLGGNFSVTWHCWFITKWPKKYSIFQTMNALTLCIRKMTWRERPM